MLLIPTPFTASLPDSPNLVTMLLEESSSRLLSVSVALETAETECAWENYLKSFGASDGPAKGRMLETVHMIWQQIKERIANSPLPITQPTAEGAIQLAWDSGGKYLDVDVLPQGGVHWYFRDRVTNEVLGTDEDPVETLPPTFFDKLRQLIQLY